MRIKLSRTVERTFFMLVGVVVMSSFVILLRQSHRASDVVMGEETAGLIKVAKRSTSSPPSWPTCQRNTSMAHTMTNFSSLPAQVQDHLYYRHCRHFRPMLDVPGKCGGAERSKDVFLLLVIKSFPDNYERREALRKTWGEERLESGRQIRRLFLVGTTGSGFERLRLNGLLELEQEEHGDILQWDFKDSFFNLTLKHILFLEWMDRNCPHVQFLLNGDDDVFANTDNIVEYLLSTVNAKERNSEHLFVGSLNIGMGVIRDPPDSKYFVPVQVQESETYPPYCGGGGYLLSGYTASVIYNMSKNITLHPIDDVFMGICLAKAGLKPAHHVGVKLFGLALVALKKIDPYHPCLYRDILLVHKFMPLQNYVMWHRVRDPNLKCGPSDLAL